MSFFLNLENQLPGRLLGKSQKQLPGYCPSSCFFWRREFFSKKVDFSCSWGRKYKICSIRNVTNMILKIYSNTASANQYFNSSFIQYVGTELFFRVSKHPPLHTKPPHPRGCQKKPDTIIFFFMGGVFGESRWNFFLPHIFLIKIQEICLWRANFSLQIYIPSIA